MKCNKCKKEISYLNTYGKLFNFKEHYCKKCWYEINGWNEEDDLGLDEFNELRIDRLTKRIEKLEKKNANK